MLRVNSILAVLLAVCVFLGTGGGTMAQDYKRVVMIISSKDFRDEELFEPKELLEKEGVRVDIASTTMQSVRGKLGATVVPNLLLGQIDVDAYDAIAFIGGPGCVEYWDDTKAHSIARQTITSGKVLAAICAAPVILANAGVLTGRKSTVFYGDAEKLREKGAVYTGAGVERDGNIITADGPTNATNFGKAILEALNE